MRLTNGTLTKPLTPPVPVKAFNAPREATTTTPADATPPPPPQVVVLPPQLSRNTASEANGKFLIVSKGPCHLVQFHVCNFSAGNVFLQLFDTHTLPSNGARPKRSWLMNTQTTYEWDAPHGRYCGNGCILAMSSTIDTLTLVTVESGIFDASFYPPA
jgi:hypothetical protein